MLGITPLVARISRASINTASIVAGLALTQKYIVGLINVEGESMAPTLDGAGSNVLVQQKIAATSFMGTGDMVILRSPTDPDVLLCKRVIGMAGQTVIPGPLDSGDLRQSNVVIPQGHMWVEGDNPPASVDSRHFGPVPIALTEGIARVQFLPRFQLLRREGVYDRIQRLGEVEWGGAKQEVKDWAKALKESGSSDRSTYDDKGHRSTKSITTKWKWSNKLQRPHPDHPHEMIYDDSMSSDAVRHVPALHTLASHTTPMDNDPQQQQQQQTGDLFAHLGSPSWYQEQHSHADYRGSATTPYNPFASRPQAPHPNTRQPSLSSLSENGGSGGVPTQPSIPLPTHPKI